MRAAAKYSRSQLSNVGRSDGSSSQVNLGDINLGDINLGDINLGDINLGDINLSDINLSDELKRARHTISLRRIQASTRCLFMDH
ncbi:uncharacterized protein UHOD_12272 [Ustilago sp. UG-2017b]|nr:uncharacterized protein UHOD_12272 [Ustilago sp. UG-2017b]